MISGIVIELRLRNRQMCTAERARRMKLETSGTIAVSECMLLIEDALQQKKATD